MVAHLDATALLPGIFLPTPAAPMSGSATPYRRDEYDVGSWLRPTRQLTPQFVLVDADRHAVTGRILAPRLRAASVMKLAGEGSAESPSTGSENALGTWWTGDPAS
jgi:hypothetical protein